MSFFFETGGRRNFFAYRNFLYLQFWGQYVAPEMGGWGWGPFFFFFSLSLSPPRVGGWHHILSWREPPKTGKSFNFYAEISCTNGGPLPSPHGADYVVRDSTWPCLQRITIFSPPSFPTVRFTSQACCAHSAQHSAQFRSIFSNLQSHYKWNWPHQTYGCISDWPKKKFLKTKKKILI